MGGRCEECKKSGLQRYRVEGAVARTAPPIVNDVLSSPGHALDSRARALFEPRFGHDFSRVRVHTDARAAESAQAVNASAYTVGRNVVFATGQYAPESSSGRQLLAHELTHVVQQSADSSSPAASLKVEAADSSCERDAERVGSRFATASEIHSPGTAATSRLQRQPSDPSAPPTTGGLDLTFDLDKGHVDIAVSGPSDTPVVAKPTIGVRRDASGRYHMLVGGKDKVVTLDEIPGMLRSAMGGHSGKSPSRQTLRIPRCDQLRLYSGKEKAPRYMTFDQYTSQQKLWHGAVGPLGGQPWMVLTEPIFDALIEFCSFELKVPPREPPVYQDLPEHVPSRGSAFA